MTLPIMLRERVRPLGSIALDEVAFSDWIECNEVFQNLNEMWSDILNTTVTYEMCRRVRVGSQTRKMTSLDLINCMRKK